MKNNNITKKSITLLTTSILLVSSLASSVVGAEEVTSADTGSTTTRSTSAPAEDSTEKEKEGSLSSINPSMVTTDTSIVSANSNDIQGSQPISTIFPDEVFAKSIADTMGKSVSDSITQDQLNQVYRTAYLTIPNGVKSLEGIRYFHELGAGNGGNSQIMANGATSLTDVSDLANLVAPSLSGIQIGSSNIASAGFDSLIAFLSNSGNANLHILNLQSDGITRELYAQLATVPNIARYSTLYVAGNHYDNFNLIHNSSMWNFAQFIDEEPIHINSNTVSFSNPSKDTVGSNLDKPLAIESATNSGVGSEDNSTVTWNASDLKGSDSVKVDVKSISRTDTAHAPHVEYTIPIIWDTMTVTAHYVDEAGNSIAPDESSTGVIGDPYETKQEEITGYTFKEVSGSINGTFDGTNQDVTYVYTKNESPVTTSTVTTKYVDENGTSISGDDVQTGNVEDSYKTEAKAITGYTLDKTKLPANAEGNYTDEDQVVTYVYKKNNVDPVDPITPIIPVSPSYSDTDVDIIARIDFYTPKNSVSASETLPQTGDDNKVSLYAALTGMIAITLAVVASVFKLRKNK